MYFKSTVLCSPVVLARTSFFHWSVWDADAYYALLKAAGGNGLWVTCFHLSCWGAEQLRGDLNPLNQADKACTHTPAHSLQEMTAQLNLQPSRPAGCTPQPVVCRLDSSGHVSAPVLTAASLVLWLCGELMVQLLLLALGPHSSVRETRGSAVTEQPRVSSQCLHQVENSRELETPDLNTSFFSTSHQAADTTPM